ncbi:hypothetical protein UABAM_01810 [Candidatus Uabimicrobium amorphum]|uniref:FHA domain-containing protein n=2 Tax=Uabimicrobium amorphum TaxID=2596890 RepID=A0A5S9IKC3_UABAM|nr:hypothetical protein UABAM_01810 [Candidatus Uabimicrobium amorphum]
MVVKKYVSSSKQLEQRAPDYAHEVLSIIPIIKDIFAAFHHQECLYAIIANLDEEEVAADLVVVTRRGIGVVELKGNYGLVHYNEKRGHWHAGKVVVKGGSNNKYGNPHKQVQMYANRIRTLLQEAEAASFPWDKFRFNTAVCFTHKKAKFGKFRDWYMQKQEFCEEWEQFNILSPQEIPDWVASLRFEHKRNFAEDYEPYSLSNEQIEHIVTQLFRTVEWSEIDQLMPDGNPYGYLTIANRGTVGNHSLKFDCEIIGRSAKKSNFIIPASFEKVSGKHLEITRTVAGVFIKDAGSKNGTYMDGEKIHEKILLKDQQKIYLGGKDEREACILKFSLTPPDASQTI